MAEEKFDSLAKVLAGSTSRRRALKGVAAVGAGGLLTFLGRQRTEAAKCDWPLVNCAGRCVKHAFECEKGEGGRPTAENRGQAAKD
jgi:hypothetical protein